MSGENDKWKIKIKKNTIDWLGKKAFKYLPLKYFAIKYTNEINSNIETKTKHVYCVSGTVFIPTQKIVNTLNSTDFFKEKKFKRMTFAPPKMQLILRKSTF